MSERAPDNQNYVGHHPDAVQDIEKAHTLALAGNALETQSAELRTQAINDLGHTAYNGGYITAEAGEAAQAAAKIKRNNELTDSIYSQHGKAYDELQATKR